MAPRAKKLETSEDKPATKRASKPRAKKQAQPTEEPANTAPAEETAASDVTQPETEKQLPKYRRTKKERKAKGIPDRAEEATEDALAEASIADTRYILEQEGIVNPDAQANAGGNDGFSITSPDDLAAEDSMLLTGSPEPVDPDEGVRFAYMMMGEDLDNFEPWSSELYGAMVKNARKRAGHGTAATFGDAIFRRTRVYISRDVMYKIEQGRQDPTIVQFMAINMTLFGAPVPNKVTMPCISPEWRQIASHRGEIPESWKEDNTKVLEEATNQVFNTVEAAARAAKDDPRLFAIPKRHQPDEPPYLTD